MTQGDDTYIRRASVNPNRPPKKLGGWYGDQLWLARGQKPSEMLLMAVRANGQYTHVEYEQETDGRWIADVLCHPGVMAYGATKREAAEAVHRILLNVR